MDGDSVRKDGPENLNEILSSGRVGDINSYFQLLDWPVPKAEHFVRNTVWVWLKRHPNFDRWVQEVTTTSGQSSDLWNVLIDKDGDQLIQSFTMIDRKCEEKVERRINEFKSSLDFDAHMETAEDSVRIILLSFVYNTALALIECYDNKRLEQLENESEADSNSDSDLEQDAAAQKETTVPRRCSPLTLRTQTTPLFETREQPQQQISWQEKFFRIHYGTREKDIPMKDCIQDTTNGINELNHGKFLERLISIKGWSKNWELIWEHNGTTFDLVNNVAFHDAVLLYRNSLEAVSVKFWDLSARAAKSLAGLKRKSPCELSESDGEQETSKSGPTALPKRPRLGDPDRNSMVNADACMDRISQLSYSQT